MQKPIRVEANRLNSQQIGQNFQIGQNSPEQIPAARSQRRSSNFLRGKFLLLRRQVQARIIKLVKQIWNLICDHARQSEMIMMSFCASIAGLVWIRPYVPPVFTICYYCCWTLLTSCNSIRCYASLVKRINLFNVDNSCPIFRAMG